MFAGQILASQSPLRATNAVAAIIMVEGAGYLLQLRDDIPKIWYPAHWGLFGGAVDKGEEEVVALRRELREELKLELAAAKLFVRFAFDLRPAGLNCYSRAYYEVPVSAPAYRRLVLQEGAEMRTFAGEEALLLPRISPYDGFALFMHHQRWRITH